MHKKYIFIFVTLFLSGCQQASIESLSQLSIDRPSFSMKSTCETRSLQGKKFDSIWNRMRSGFCFRDIHSSRITEELKWMKRNKDFVYRSIERSKPYLHHILTYLEKMRSKKMYLLNILLT